MDLSKFGTKKELTEYVRQVLRVIFNKGWGDSRCVEEGREFIEGLLGKHPDSATKLKGMKRMEVVCTGIGRSGWSVYGILLHYEDGRVDDVSWAACVANSGCGRAKKKEPANEGRPSSEMNSALRHAVSPQITAYRRRRRPECANCGLTVVDEAMHVDHDVVGFAELVREFLGSLSEAERERMERGVVSAPEVMARHRFHEDVRVLEKRWQRYHAKNAHLQLVCAHCNLSVLKIARRGT